MYYKAVFCYSRTPVLTEQASTEQIVKISKNRAIIRKFNVISRCLSYVREVQFSEFGISRAQQTFCSRIYENPGISQNALSYLLKMDKTTTSKSIKNLIDLGFVIRHKSKDNLKEWKLYTTEKFDNMRHDLDEVISQTNSKILANLEKEELEQLDQILDKIRDNIYSEWERIKYKNH